MNNSNRSPHFPPLAVVACKEFLCWWYCVISQNTRLLLEGYYCHSIPLGCPGQQLWLFVFVVVVFFCLFSCVNLPSQLCVFLCIKWYMCCIFKYMHSAMCVLIMHVYHVSTVMCASNLQCSFLPGAITSHCSMINVWYWQSACVALKWNNRLSPAGAVHSVFWHIISDMDPLMICRVFLPFFFSCFLFPFH